MSKYLSYPMKSQDYLNRFLISGIFTRPESFRPEVLKGRVNEWLKKGFSIHENPCRQEFIARRLQQIPICPQLQELYPGSEWTEFDQKQSFSLYFPWKNNRVERSAFYFTPTYLRMYAYTELFSETAQTIELEAVTCGGLTLWLNDRRIFDFSPFTRNLPKSHNFTLALAPGINKLWLCLDDLAERDTDFYFSLKILKALPFSVQLPLPEPIDADEIRAAENWLSDFSIPKEVYLKEPVEMVFRTPAPKNYKLDYYASPAISTKLPNRHQLILQGSEEIAAGHCCIKLWDTDSWLPEFYHFTFTISIGIISLSCRAGAQIFDPKLLTTAPSEITERKARALEYLAAKGVNNSYRAAALLEIGENQEDAEAIIAEDLWAIRQRMDCSDFYFVVILYLAKKYSQVLSSELLEDIRQTALGFRYWIDEPGDDVMWFFSENHALLFHLCQYFAADLYPDARFLSSGLSATEAKSKALHLLDQWFREFFEEFMTEWNSSAYIPVDMVGLAALYNYESLGKERTPSSSFIQGTKSSALLDKAQRSLDMIARCLAINHHTGVNAVTFGRSYEEQIKGNYTSGTTSILYLLYGQGYLNRAGMGYVMLAAGSYQPPQDYYQFLAVPQNKALQFQVTQGYDKHVNLYLYKTAGAILSTATAFKPFEKGYQEHIVQATLSPLAQSFINHPGEKQPYGSGRPAYWAGNGVLPLAAQYQALSIVLWELPSDCEIDYTHAYFPIDAFKEVYLDSHCAIGVYGGSYIALWAKQGIELKERGCFAKKELISSGNENLWLIQIGEYQKYPSLSAIAEEISSCSPTIQQRTVNFSHPCYGQIQLSPAKGLVVNSETIPFGAKTCDGLLAWL